MTIKLRKGSIVKLKPDTARWAGFVYGRVVEAHNQGSLFVVGKQSQMDGDDPSFISEGAYTIIAPPRD